MLTGTEEVYHPDPEKGKLPPQPILLVATSDDALRLFSFASLKRSADGITHAALPYSEASYPMVAQAASQVGLLLKDLCAHDSWYTAQSADCCSLVPPFGKLQNILMNL